jgi:hypothetical protein
MRIAIGVFCILLAGCAAPDYRATPTMKLCMDYLTFPSGNIWQGDRARELERRGENCQAYAGTAAVRNQADALQQQRQEAAIRAMTPPPQPPRPQVTCRTIPLGGGYTRTDCN